MEIEFKYGVKRLLFNSNVILFKLKIVWYIKLFVKLFVYKPLRLKTNVLKNLIKGFW